MKGGKGERGGRGSVEKSGERVEGVWGRGCEKGVVYKKRRGSEAFFGEKYREVRKKHFASA